jgi:hypothetical protein
MSSWQPAANACSATSTAHGPPTMFGTIPTATPPMVTAHMVLW